MNRSAGVPPACRLSFAIIATAKRLNNKAQGWGGSKASTSAFFADVDALLHPYPGKGSYVRSTLKGLCIYVS
jgi:hypothetical protein